MSHDSQTSPLISATELAALLQGVHPAGGKVVVLDVRWRLDRPNGRPEDEVGHIPGAVFVDLNTELAGQGAPEEGRHPLPDVDDLQAAARSWGIDERDTV